MQNKYLLLIYHEQNKACFAVGEHRGKPYGSYIQPEIMLILRTRKETNKIITNLNEQWIKQLKIHKPNKPIHLTQFTITTDYTLFTHFVNKIRRFFNLPEKY